MLERMLPNLALATFMVAVTVLVHFWGFIGLTWGMGRHGARLHPHESHLRRASVILLVVLGIFALHTIEIWLYAALFRLLGETHNFEERCISRP